MYRNWLHFYTPIMKQQKEMINESIPFTIAPNIIKYLGINLIKEVKDLYSENYKILIKEIEVKNNNNNNNNNNNKTEKHYMLIDLKNKYC